MSRDASRRARKRAANGSRPKEVRERQAAYQRANPERCAAYKAKYRSRPEVRAKEAAYRRANAERCAAYKAKYRSRPEVRALEAATAAKWRKENAERLRLRHAEYRKENRKRISVRERQYCKENRERKTANKAKWRAENRERDAATNTKWAKENRERRHALDAKYRKKNRKITRERCRKRRVLKMALPYVEHVAPMPADGRCPHCRVPMVGEWPALNTPTLDHIIPLTRGGHHSPENTQMICSECNTIKRDHPLSFLLEKIAARKRGGARTRRAAQVQKQPQPEATQ